tara:strand:- start:10459 stop:11019 length:561 start_codon:yes stop_codon:yes gene_type:complete
MNKMIKLNKVTKEQVAEALRVLLEKQVEIANRPNKPYDPSENDWIKEMDARERGEEPFQHVTQQRWNFYKAEVGNPFDMRDEIIDVCKNPPQPEIEEVVVRVKQDEFLETEIHVGTKSKYSRYDYFQVVEYEDGAINIYLRDMGYDLFNMEDGGLTENFMAALKPLETDDQYFEWVNNSNISINNN